MSFAGQFKSGSLSELHGNFLFSIHLGFLQPDEVVCLKRAAAD